MEAVAQEQTYLEGTGSTIFAGYPLVAFAFALSILRNFTPGPLPEHPATRSLEQEGSTVDVGCDDGVIRSVDFAPFVQPSGICTAGLQQIDSCDAPLSLSVAEKACLGIAFCFLLVNADTFGGDPCFGMPKPLAVRISCKSQIV